MPSPSQETSKIYSLIDHVTFMFNNEDELSEAYVAKYVADHTPMHVNINRAIESALFIYKYRSLFDLAIREMVAKESDADMDVVVSYLNEIFAMFVSDGDVLPLVEKIRRFISKRYPSYLPVVYMWEKIKSELLKVSTMKEIPGVSEASVVASLVKRLSTLDKAKFELEEKNMTEEEYMAFYEMLKSMEKEVGAMRTDLNELKSLLLAFGNNMPKAAVAEPVEKSAAPAVSPELGAGIVAPCTPAEKILQSVEPCKHTESRDERKRRNLSSKAAEIWNKMQPTGCLVPMHVEYDFVAAMAVAYEFKCEDFTNKELAVELLQHMIESLNKEDPDLKINPIKATHAMIVGEVYWRDGLKFVESALTNSEVHRGLNTAFLMALKKDNKMFQACRDIGDKFDLPWMALHDFLEQTMK